MRIGVASIIQETNTFSPRRTELADFAAHGLWRGAQAGERSRGTNTEIAGALAALEDAGAVAVPLVRAWAMSDGPLTGSAFAALLDVLREELEAAGALDGLLLCLHGALVAEQALAADAALAGAARAALPGGPLVVTHDLHANVTRALVDVADAVIGFRTYPHVDQADTGRRGAELVLGADRGLRTVLAKRPMVVPAEAQAIADEPMRSVRRAADAALRGDVLDVSLFPVQPWLDVPELGFGVTVTTCGDPAEAVALAEDIAELAWSHRAGFRVRLWSLDEAVERVRASAGPEPVLLVQSADSPTAGATADDPSVVAALLDRGHGLRALATLVDVAAVAACHDAGPGARVTTAVGASLDDRWARPVRVEGRVVRVGAEPVVLEGQSMTGQQVSMGRWATLDTGGGLIVLVTERPAPGFDPAAYRTAGLDPADADAVVVRSATMYRAGYRGLYAEALVLDLPGASTPRLDYLDFRHAPRPLYPLDAA